MYRWAVLTGGAVLGALVWLLDTAQVRAVLTGPPPGDLTGPVLSQRPRGGAGPADPALWVFLAVAAAVLVVGAVRCRVSHDTFHADPAVGADRTPTAGDAEGR